MKKSRCGTVRWQRERPALTVSGRPSIPCGPPNRFRNAISLRFRWLKNDYEFKKLCLKEKIQFIVWNGLRAEDWGPERKNRDIEVGVWSLIEISRRLSDGPKRGSCRPFASGIQFAWNCWIKRIIVRITIKSKKYSPIFLVVACLMIEWCDLQLGATIQSNLTSEQLLSVK